MPITTVLRIITVAYEKQIELRGLIDSFLLQTYTNWKMDIVHDGPASKEYIRFLKNIYGLNIKTGEFTDKRIRYWESEKRYHTKENPTWGHPNRGAMLKQLKGKKDDFVLITNDDNYYVPKFIEYFMEVITPEIGLVYCDTVHSHSGYKINYSRIKEHCIDMGAFIVRLDIAQETGFNHTCFSADGKYCEECNANLVSKGLKSFYIPKTLFVHN